MRFSFSTLSQRLRGILGRGDNDGPVIPPVHPDEVEQAAEDRRTATEEERAAAETAAREVMERLRREGDRRAGED